MRLALVDCPATMRPHAEAVLRGEYALPAGYALVDVQTVLDLGANVGAFSLWARTQWPAAEILAYEPDPANARRYETNTGTACVVAAVTDRPGRARLYAGRNNCGEASLTPGPEQVAHVSREVELVDARTLPRADVVKVDTEGEELAILGALDLSQTSCVMLEWHSATDRWHIGSMLARLGLDCLVDTRRRADRGVMVWAR
ncbi:MAG TPA: FkbM family methyltransferase [Polyangiaceae bacterium]|nr:FkbM family methyltransferase [Polyangiaceae bacterium]